MVVVKGQTNVIVLNVESLLHTHSEVPTIKVQTYIESDKVVLVTIHSEISNLKVKKANV